MGQQRLLQIRDAKVFKGEIKVSVYRNSSVLGYIPAETSAGREHSVSHRLAEMGLSTRPLNESINLSTHIF